MLPANLQVVLFWVFLNKGPFKTGKLRDMKRTDLLSHHSAKNHISSWEHNG